MPVMALRTLIIIDSMNLKMSQKELKILLVEKKMSMLVI